MIEEFSGRAVPVEVEITGELAKGYYLGGYSNSRNNIIVRHRNQYSIRLTKQKLL